MKPTFSAGVFLLTLLSCAAPRPEPPAAPPPPPPVPVVPPFPHEVVWTTEGTTLRTASNVVVTPQLFSRLEVLGPDSLGLRVRCAVCASPTEGWVDRDAVVFSAGTPTAAAAGDLAGFVLAVRGAALRRDLDALLPVMASGFTYSLVAPSGRLEAIAAWRRENFSTLDHLPKLLDEGIATRDDRLWVAPTAFLSDPGFSGMRTGFRREDGEWRWVFFVRER